MGCDINLYVEKFSNGRWKSIDRWNTEDKDYIHVEYDDQYYHRRNYVAFALLANVRNYHNIEPFSMPKGFPIDVSRQVKQASDNYGVDGHSHSSFTLKELLEFDWNRTIKIAGYMMNSQWDRFSESLKSDNPDYNLSYPRSQSIRDSMKNEYAWHEWKVPISTAIYDICELIIKLLELRKPPHHIRIVFFFDK